MNCLSFSIKNLMQNPFEYPLGGALPFVNIKKMTCGVATFIKPYSLIIYYFSIKFSVKNLDSNTRIELINGSVFELNNTHLDLFQENNFELRFDSLHENFSVLKNGNLIFSQASDGLINYSAPAINILSGSCEIFNIFFDDQDYSSLNRVDYKLIATNGGELFFSGEINFVDKKEDLVLIDNEKSLKRFLNIIQTIQLSNIRLLADSWSNVMQTRLIVKYYDSGYFVRSELHYFPVNPKLKGVVSELEFDFELENTQHELIFLVPPQSNTHLLIS